MSYYPEIQEENNVRPCELCGNPSSFERFNKSMPREGEICSVCDSWVCDDCVDYTHMNKLKTTDIICKDCSE